MPLPPGLFGGLTDVRRRPSRGSCSSSASFPASAKRPPRGWRSTSCARSPEDAAALAAAIAEVKQKIRFCCGLLRPDRDRPLRHLSGRAARRRPSSAWSRQPRTSSPSSGPGGYRGRYHVLHGVLSPLDGIGPDDLRVTELVARCAGPLRPAGDQSIREVILATSPSVEGRSDRRLPGQAAPPARRARHPHRDRRPDRRRAGVRRPGDAGARHRRPPRDVGASARFTDGRRFLNA